jgi:hypothetical protein
VAGVEGVAEQAGAVEEMDLADAITLRMLSRPSSSNRAPASSWVSRAAPWAVIPSSMKPAGSVHLPQRGSMLRLHSSTLSPK